MQPALMRIWVGEGVGTRDSNSSMTSKDDPVFESPMAFIVVGRAIVKVSLKLKGGTTRKLSSFQPLPCHLI